VGAAVAVVATYIEALSSGLRVAPFRVVSSERSYPLRNRTTRRYSRSVFPEVFPEWPWQPQQKRRKPFREPPGAEASAQELPRRHHST
jgi:hypothetical protein